MFKKTVYDRTARERQARYNKFKGKIIGGPEAGRVTGSQPLRFILGTASVLMPKDAAIGRQYYKIGTLILWGEVNQYGISSIAEASIDRRAVWSF
jgi:antirestriction protein ArdC